MKIQGVKEGTFIKVEKLELDAFGPDGEEIKIVLTLASIPLGFERKIEKDLPLPPIPIGPVIVDGQQRFNHKGQPLTAPNDQDPEYVQKRDYILGLRAAALLKEALRMDKSVEFESVQSGYEKYEEYCEALFKELEDAGFTSRVLKKIIDKVNDISGVEKKDIEKKKNFS